jgi:hypothetical protein
MTLSNSFPEVKVFSAHWILVRTNPTGILDKKVNIKFPTFPLKAKNIQNLLGHSFVEQLTFIYHTASARFQ